MDTFLGVPNSAWTGLEAIAVIASTVVVAVTGLLVYGQVKVAARTYQFQSIVSLQVLVDSFAPQREEIFREFPVELVVHRKQFTRYPPKRHYPTKASESDTSIKLTPEQIAAVKSLTSTQMKTARLVIGKLNDLGELVEDGYVSQRVFLSKYHTMILRLCYILEPIRRHFQSESGGNYGHRLLRMRHLCEKYNSSCPKHRMSSVKVDMSDGEVIILSAQPSSRIHRLIWRLRHFLGRY